MSLHGKKYRKWWCYDKILVHLKEFAPHTTSFTFISSIFFCCILSSFFSFSHLFFFLLFLQIECTFKWESKIQCHITFFTFIPSILFCHILSSFFSSSHLFFFLPLHWIVGVFGWKSKFGQCSKKFDDNPCYRLLHRNHTTPFSL